MRKLIIILLAFLPFCGITTQAQNAEVNSLVITTADGKSVNYKLSDISEITFANIPAESSSVVRVLNLTPDFFSLSDISEGQELEAGTKATITLTAGETLSGIFNDYHFQHIHLHVNDKVYVPEVPDNITSTEKIEIPFTVPEGALDIVACYSVQQQTIPSGYTMTMEPNDKVALYGVSPEVHYKYFDAWLLAEDAYLVTNVEYKMGDSDWVSVEDSYGCSIKRDSSVPNLFNVSIRPDYKNVTGDVVLRVNGEQHYRHNITWKNATATYVDMEKSTFPIQALNGDQVVAELYVNDSYYLNNACASDGSEVSTISRAYVSFTMPDNDVTIDLDFLKKVPVSYMHSEHVTEAKFYNAPDPYYGWPVEIGIPGEEVYLFAKVEEGYKPMTATTDDGKIFDFKYYGLNHDDLPYYCPVTITDGASSMSATISCARAWHVTSQSVIACEDGEVFAKGENVKFSIQVPTGKKISSVTARTTSGADVPLTLDLPYGTLVMPEEDVTINVVYEDLEVGTTVTVKAFFDEDQYGVRSTTNYDWDLAEGFTIDRGATFYLSVIDYYGENFYVGVKIGENVNTYPANMDEDSGEYSFGKALVADGDVVIKVGPTQTSVAF